jgi:hypothetical protein
MCVQRLDDPQGTAVHITFRASLRSSSLREPRDPPSKVFGLAFVLGRAKRGFAALGGADGRRVRLGYGTDPSLGEGCPLESGSNARASINDPSAGSPTETLLRLLLPLNGQV